MNREFLALYNRELQVLSEHAREFAEEYPGIAERLGGLVAERMDPMVAGLLEGAAFLAARVQLKLKHEFPEFTNNLIEQLVPNYLAPTPSAMLAKIVPPYSDPGLRDGSRIRRGGLDFDLEERAVYCGEEPLHLTRSEYAICAHLAAHPAQTFTKEQIYEAVFGFDGTADSSAITEHIKNIRAKLRAVGLSPIQTVWGVGYKWESA